MRYSATVAVPCRIEGVFASLIDRTSHPKLKSQSVEQTPPGEIGLGTTFRYRMAGHPEFTHATRLCDFEPTTILRWQTDWPGREPSFEIVRIEIAARSDDRLLPSRVREAVPMAASRPDRRRVLLADLPGRCPRRHPVAGQEDQEPTLPSIDGPRRPSESTTIRSPGLRFRYAWRSPSSAADAPYRLSIWRLFQPARRMRSPSVPPSASHMCAYVCRNW